MAADHAETVDQLILAHLDDAHLPPVVGDLVLGALLGEEDLAAVLGGATLADGRSTSGETHPAEPAGTYLASVEVSGFRGIGPAATLSLVPSPGLTIVTGRNGSGKSSFAEAAELALTGENKRWAGRSAIWQDGWRNLHTAGETYIRVRLGVEGHRGGATVERRWAADAGLAGCSAFFQLAGRPRQPAADLGWRTALELHRPFLSYAELGGLLSGKPSEMHDSLQRILGLQRLVEIEKMLKDARKEMDDRRKRADATLPALVEALAAHLDPRARQAEQILAARTPDLGRLDALGTADERSDDARSVPLRQLDVLEMPEPEQVAAEIGRLRRALGRIDELTGTPAAEARALAGLLGDALGHYRSHPDQPCPVCGGRILNAEWAERADAELHRLTERAEQLDQAHLAVQRSRAALREMVPTPPSALSLDLSADGVQTGDARTAWRKWDDLVSVGEPGMLAETASKVFDGLLASLRPMRTAARAALRRRRQEWQLVADQIRDWVGTARASRHAKQRYAALQKAIGWLRDVGDQIRNEKLAPLATQATEIWSTLRQESNVDLDAIRLAGTGPTRRVDLRVNVDGSPGAALGVMSQGELHSLALALFLPRATVAQSPFRFLVIDDPVQSMDPVKVYGLAEVLDRVARQRQVIVFTHDDRLPAAVRHLGLDARILIVDRLAHSQVTVTGDRYGDPARRYLDDARAVARDDGLDGEVRGPVVCSLVRHAIEYTCQERVRIRDFRAGTPIAATEAALGRAQGLRPTLTLALLPGDDRSGELPDALRRLHPAAARVVTAANHGVHGDHAVPTLLALVNDAEQVIGALKRS